MNRIILVYVYSCILLSGPGILAQSIKTCVQKTYRGPDKPMVCVCNSTYCDEFPPLGVLQPGQAAIYTSTISGKRFERTNQMFSANTTSPQIQLIVDTSKTFQKIIGFGGAFTDSAAINLFNLSQQARQNLVNSYFAQEGIGYTIGRVNMAACDFSTRDYSYDDVDGDFNLTNFALAIEDLNFKIPFIKMAQSLMESKLKLYSSPWSAPKWMKTNGQFVGGSLKGNVGGIYYHSWAQYFVRFFEEYAKQGINFWGLTVQNEPNVGDMRYNGSMERDFVKFNLGPTLKGNALTKNLKVMILDDNRYTMPAYPDVILSDPDAAKYVDGIGVHWYSDKFDNGIFNNSNLQQTHEAHPDKFILYTEACTGWNGVQGPSLGDWSRGDHYAHNIMEDLSNWVTGWVDWNMCLDPQGGPNWQQNWVDSPIIVNATSDEFYKNPMYYVLGHFSKFIVEDSVRVALYPQGITSSVYLEAIAFLTPQNQLVLVINNRDVATNYAVTVADMSMPGKQISLNLESRSITTIVWNSSN